MVVNSTLTIAPDNVDNDLILQSLERHLSCSSDKASILIHILTQLSLSKMPKAIIMVLERVLLFLENNSYYLSMPLLKCINHLSIHALSISTFFFIPDSSQFFDRIINWQLLQLIFKGTIESTETITFESIIETITILLQYQHYSLLSMEYQLATQFVFKIYDPNQIATIYLPIYIERFLNYSCIPFPMSNDIDNINISIVENHPHYYYHHDGGGHDSDHNDFKLEKMAQEVAMIATMLLDNKNTDTTDNNFVKSCRVLYEQFKLISDSNFFTKTNTNTDSNTDSNENSKSENEKEEKEKRKKFILFLLLWNRIDGRIKELTMGTIDLFTQLKLGNQLFEWIGAIEDYLFPISTTFSLSPATRTNGNYHYNGHDANNNNSNDSSLSLFNVLVLLQGMQLFIHEASNKDHEMLIKYLNMLLLRLIEKLENLTRIVKDEDQVEDYHDQLDKLIIMKLLWIVFYYSRSSKSTNSYNNNNNKNNINSNSNNNNNGIENNYCPLSKFYWELIEMDVEKNAELTQEQYDSWSVLEKAILEAKWDLIGIIKIHSFRDIMNRLEQKENNNDSNDSNQSHQSQSVNQEQIIILLHLKEMISVMSRPPLSPPPSYSKVMPLVTIKGTEAITGIRERVKMETEMERKREKEMIIEERMANIEQIKKEFSSKCKRAIKDRNEKLTMLWINVIMQPEFLIDPSSDLLDLINEQLIKNKNVSYSIKNHMAEKLFTFWKNDKRAISSRMIMVNTIVDLLLLQEEEERDKVQELKALTHELVRLSLFP